MIPAKAHTQRGFSWFALWLGLIAFCLPSAGQRRDQPQNPPDMRGNRAGRGQEGRPGIFQNNRTDIEQMGRRGMVQSGRPVADRSDPGAMGQVGRPVQTQPNRQVSPPGPPMGVLPNRPGMIQPGRPGFMQPAQPAEPASMRLRLEDQDLTAEIRATPLQQVLDELAARTGVIFEIESQVNPKISVNFYRVSLQEAIDRLTGTNDSISFYERNSMGQSQLRFVRILARTPSPLPPSLRYLGSGEITKQGIDTIDSPEQAIMVLAENADVTAREKAIEVLVVSRISAVVPVLKIALTDTAAEVRVAAIEGLASLTAREALPEIVRALKDSHPGVRQSAVVAVSLLGEVANLKDLRPLLRDPDASVAAAADLAYKRLSARLP